MIKNIKYILPIIIASAIVLSAHISLAEEIAGNNPFPEGKASSVSFSPTPEMIAEDKKQQAGYLRNEGVSSSTELIREESRQSEYSITPTEKVSMLGYAVLACFVWLIVVTIVLFRKRERE